MNKKYHKALTIAGSDSSGGAGIQADIKTFSALGCYGMSVLTALTAQNTRGVVSVQPVLPSFVGEQLQAVLDDIGPDAIKIGMLCSAETVEVIARLLRRHMAKNIVLDPVLSAHTGERLSQDGTFEAMQKILMPLVTLFTPNLPEVSAILKWPIHTLDDMREAAVQLATRTSGDILIKGGHLEDPAVTDLLYIHTEKRFVVLETDRIVTRNTHGTGCTLSSAIASFLARGLTCEQAVITAKRYVTEAIRAGSDYALGSGRGPVHHFHEFW
ncbi:MAG: bifunctional hydroxymethylpyrimidine kinase/phosphomethylpyrimidine kinase [Deltaproteobacteria bacterium]|nr:MAG: bifunctional hydroxymethylpyrimidine kinase/phosphomethylpyrimidine kinase [Deltaproteobacteria bacterium]